MHMYHIDFASSHGGTKRSRSLAGSAAWASLLPGISRQRLHEDRLYKNGGDKSTVLRQTDRSVYTTGASLILTL